MNFGNSILKYRKQSNLSQEEVANKIGVTRQTISKWELNETIPDLKQAIKLAKLFDISIGKLIEEENKETTFDKKEKVKVIFKVLKIVGIILFIIIFIISMYVILSTYVKDYFSASPTGQGVATYCNYKNNITLYEVWRYYDTNDIFLKTTDKEILEKFKPYNYVHEQKMLADIIEYIESNGGICNIET